MLKFGVSDISVFVCDVRRSEFRIFIITVANLDDWRLKVVPPELGTSKPNLSRKENLN